MSSDTANLPPLPSGSRIRRYPATAGEVPPEVAALGEPEHVHSPISLSQELSDMIGGLFGKKPSPPAIDKPTYMSFAEVLVTVHHNVYTVIPWDEITHWRHPLDFGISSGQKFPVNADWKDFGVLHGKARKPHARIGAAPRAGRD